MSGQAYWIAALSARALGGKWNMILWCARIHAPFLISVMRFVSAVIMLCAGLLIPVAGFGASFTTLEEELELFQKDLQYFVDQQDALENEEQAETSDELFPPLAEGEEGAEEDRTYEEDPIFVTIRVDGVPVVLSDVERSSWFAPYVRSIADMDIISGYRDAVGRPLGAFGPGDDVTVEQLAKIALLAAGTNVERCEGDVLNPMAQESWSEAYIRCAEQLGWVLFSDGTVKLDRPAQRNEVVVTIMQALRAPFDDFTGGVFEDVDTSTEFAAAIETAAHKGIVAGYADEQGNPTGLFGPQDPVNRAEATKIVTLALQVFGE
jgi:hypothetical protein